MNRDTLYSAAVFDLDAEAVTITLPDAAKRFMSMQVIDEDQYTPAVIYSAGDRRCRIRGRCSARKILNGSWTFPESKAVR